MEIIKLQTRPRTGSKKKYTNKSRLTGWIPAIYYGHNREPKMIEVDHREFSAVVRARKTSHLFNLGLEAKDESIAVIKEVQRHVLKDSLFYHIDFQHVNMNEKITVEVPIKVTGIPVGVKDSGGVLGHPVKVIKVECMPVDIPEEITIDVTALNIGDSIHVRDLNVPNLTIKESEDEVLAVVTHPTREVAEEAKPAEAAEAAPATGAPGGAPGAAPKAAPGAAPKAAADTKKKEK